MDKLKFIKILVFLLTFGIVFILCLGVTKIVQNNQQSTIEMNLGFTKDVVVEQMSISEDRLYLLTNKRNIHIIDLKKGQKEGIIYLSGSKSNGKEE